MEIDGALHSLTRSLAVAMYRDGTGVYRATLKMTQGTMHTYTLTNAEDITNFEVGMEVVFYG